MGESLHVPEHVVSTELAEGVISPQRPHLDPIQTHGRILLVLRPECSSGVGVQLRPAACRDLEVAMRRRWVTVGICDGEVPLAHKYEPQNTGGVRDAAVVRNKEGAWS